VKPAEWREERETSSKPQILSRFFGVTTLNWSTGGCLLAYASICASVYFQFSGAWYVVFFLLSAKAFSNEGFILKTRKAEDTGMNDGQEVVIKLKRGNLVYGSDAGSCTFEDGMLFFDGDQTTFSFDRSLLAAGLSPRNSSARPPSVRKPWQERTLVLMVEGKTLEVSFQPISDEKSGSFMKAFQFSKSLDAWYEAPVEPRNVQVAPPVVASADCLQDAKFRLEKSYVLYLMFGGLLAMNLLQGLHELTQPRYRAEGIFQVTVVSLAIPIIFGSIFFFQWRSRKNLKELESLK